MGLFNGYLKEGPGVHPDEPQKKSFFRFFEIYFKRFWKLILLNLLYLACCIPIVTIGPATAGFTIVLRNWANDRHSFLHLDFFDGFKKNWKQGLGFSLISLFVWFSLFYSIDYWYDKTEAAAVYFIPFLLCVFILIEFLFMTYYIWPMIVTFKLSMKNILKNGLIFAIACLKQNILITFFILILTIPYILCVIISPFLAILFSTLFLSTIGLMVNFIVYPQLKKFIIDPYYRDNPNELKKTAGQDEEQIFSDDHMINQDEKK